VGLYLQARVPGVTQAEAHLLAHLHEADGEASVADLHRAWAHKRSTLTDILDRLEGRGLARRSVLPADRRSVLVRLTAEGRRSASAVHRELAALEREVLARTGGAALTGFGELVGALGVAAEAAASRAMMAARAEAGRRRR
jgi:DNA-binding MarR family transcriptional regulator